MIDKKVSVIVPVYNVEKNVRKCINSICCQTYNNLQIIIVDDGSEDSSFRICKELAEKDNRIELYSQSNKGVSSARNLGIKKATGDYITFVDSDDYLDLNAYEIALKEVNDNDAIYYGFVEIYETDNIIKTISPEFEGTADSDIALYNCLLPSGYHSSSCNKIFKNNIVKDHFYNEKIKIGEDELWLFEITKKLKKVMMISSPLYYYVQRDKSVMHEGLYEKDKWKTALFSKKSIINLLNGSEEYYYLTLAKAYNDMFPFVWISYINDSYDSIDEINRNIKDYKLYFYKSREYGIKRKIKYMLISIMINLNMPKMFVKTIGDITTFKMKVLLSEGKRI